MDDKKLHRLLEKVSKENCKHSFDTIFGYYYPKLVDFADLYLECRKSAEEVASDALLKFFVKRHHLLSIEKPQSYLYTTVKNLSISQIRKTKKDINFVRQSELLELQKFEPETSPENNLLEEEFSAVIMKIVDTMPPRRKMIFKLIKQEDKSYKEVSALLNISVKTVEVHMGLAIAQLRLSLENYEKRNQFNYLQIVKFLFLFLHIFNY